MSIQEMITKALLDKQEKKKNRTRSNKFNPSSFGRCYRNQYWNRQDEPVTNPVNVKSLMNFEEGSYTHSLIQDQLPVEMVEKEIDSEDVFGRADIVEEDAVTDIKSAEARGFKAFHDIPSDKFVDKNPHYFLQTGWYACMLKKKYIRIRSNVKGSLQSFRIHEQPTELWKDKVQHELDMLRMYWDKQELPPAEPRAFNGRDCTYCAWRKKCDEVEDGNR